MQDSRSNLKRALGYFLAFGTLLAVLAVPALAESSSEPIPESPAAAELPAPSAAEVAEAEARQKERTEWLSSPEAAREREASQAAYAAITSEEAQSLLVEAFPEQLRALNEDPGRVISDLQIEKPLGTYGALVSEPGGEESILESSVPVESENGGEGAQPVDLSLEPSGEGFAPANPITMVELPASAEGDVSLQEGVGISLPSDDDHEAVPLGEENLFIPETEQATDTLLSPIAAGVEISEQLRSAESPEEFRFELELQKGATLEATAGGGAEVLAADGGSLVKIPPSSAFDAQGAPVPTYMKVAGDDLVVEVPHQGESDFAYPILVDPEFLQETTNFGAWGQDTSGGYGLRNLGSSLNAYSESYRLYGANTDSQWVYTAPGETAYIAAATFKPVDFLVGSCYTSQPHGYIGLYNVASGHYDSLGVYSGGNSESEFQTGWVGGYWTRDAMIGIGSGNESIAIPCYHEIYVGGYTIQEKDPYPPSVSVSGVPGGWFDPAKAGAANISALDTGFGVHWISMEELGGGSVHAPISCSGLSTSRCPREYGWSESPPYKPGERTLQITAEDAIGNVGSWSQTTKVDTEKPEIDLGGQLAYVTEEDGVKGEENKASENQLSLPVYNLHIEATDGSNAEPTRKQSGVRNIEVFLDGVNQSVPWKAQECPASSCKMEENFELKLLGLTAGVHKLKVDASDEVGLTREREIEFEYIPATGTEDGNVLQHFPLGNTEGEGSNTPELEVNVTNGNLVFHQQDVEVEGPSADLEVERFYNSELPKEQSSEWGTGWTLAQTPVLEPEKTKGGAPPATTAMVGETGSIDGAVPLPTEPEATRFSPELQAAITKQATGYEVRDESGESDNSLAFNKAGEVEEMRTSGAATVQYEYKGGDLSEIALEDPASAGSRVGEAAAREEIVRTAPEFQASFGSQGTGSGQLDYPEGVAVATNGDVYVADTGNDRVQEFSAGGSFIRAWGSEGTGNGQFKSPRGIAVASNGNVYVADSLNDRIQEFNEKGEFITKWGAPGPGNGQFEIWGAGGPWGVAVAPNGNVYVTDEGNFRVQEFSPSGEFITKWGSKGRENGQFVAVHGIAVSPSGQVYVADEGNADVQEFTSAGAFITKWGTEGAIEGQFRFPHGIAIAPNGNVYVADEGNDRVQEFSSKGEFLTTFGNEGSGAGEFNDATNVAVAPDGDVYAVDKANHRVQQFGFSKAVAHASDFGSEGSGSGQFKYPEGMAVAPDGSLYVADTGNDRVQRFSSSGKYVGSWGTEGTANGQFRSPRGIAVSRSGRVYVVDSGNDRIEEFSSSGEFITAWGSPGSESGQFNRPWGIAIGAGGDLYVTDEENQRIEVFSPSGAYVTKWGVKGAGNGQLNYPHGIAAASNGNLYVAEEGNARVQEFTLGGGYVTKWGTEGSGPGQFRFPHGVSVAPNGDVYVADEGNDRIQEFGPSGSYISQFGSEGSGPGQFNDAVGITSPVDGRIWATDKADDRVEAWLVEGEEPGGEELVPVEADPSVQVSVVGGLVSRVEGEGVGHHAYAHEGELLSAVSGPQGETKYKYEGAGRLSKVELPNGTWAEIAYESLGRVRSVTVSMSGGKAKTTNFTYSDEPRETVVSFETEPTVHYLIGADGSVLKWWNAKVPPEIEELTGSLYTQRGEVHPEPISSGDQELRVAGHSFEGIASIQIVADGDQLIAEKSCEESKCVKLEKAFVTETENWPPGILQLEVIVTDHLGQVSSQRFWDNIPYTPPPAPEALEPPKFEEILRFREEFGLDLDIKGNENALDERIFDLIAAWHNPSSPEGEVARASMERWGVPLRPQDVAEMEYREGYIAQDGALIEEWGETHASAEYAGYYVDNRDGGLIRVGFTHNAASDLESLKSEIGLTAPGVVSSYTAAANAALTTLQETDESVMSLWVSNATLESSITFVEVDSHANTVDIGATEPGAVSSILAGDLGPGAPVTVVPAPSEIENDFSLEAGDHIRSVHLLSAEEEEIRNCTAGPGAYETRAKKANGQAVRAEFLLTAGHCFPIGELVEKSAYPRGTNNFTWIGKAARTAYPGHEHYEEDAEAIRLENFAAPSYIYRANRSSLAVHEAGWIRPGETLCFSGVSSGLVQCGSAVGIRAVKLKTKDEPDHGRELAIRFSGHSIHGDSGSPVWEAKTKEVVGIFHASLEGDLLAAPLLQPRGFSSEKAPGVLAALDAAGGGQLSLERAP